MAMGHFFLHVFVTTDKRSMIPCQGRKWEVALQIFQELPSWQVKALAFDARQKSWKASIVVWCLSHQSGSQVLRFVHVCYLHHLSTAQNMSEPITRV